MVRHGNRSKKRLPDLSLVPPVEPTPAELCPPGEDHNEQDDITVAPGHRIFTRRRWWKGQLIEFAMSYLTLSDEGEWVERARADTCHREVHLHMFSTLGEETERELVHPITDFTSVDRGYDVCDERIYDVFALCAGS
jgi:hypothetical protein